MGLIAGSVSNDSQMNPRLKMFRSGSNWLACDDASSSEADLFDDETQVDLVAMNTQVIDVNHLYLNSERSITGSVKHVENIDTSIITTQTSMEDTTSVSGETTTTQDTTTTERDETTTMEEDGMRETTEVTTDTLSTTGVEDTTLPSTTLVTGFTDTEERLIARVEDLTTTSRAEELTTMVNTTPNDTTTTTMVTPEINGKNTSSSSGLNKSLPTEIEAILNKTKLVNKDEDYDYDYNEPSLPPSLPNLRIIPFVAADAVVDDRQEPVFSAVLEKSHSTDEPHFFEGGFSPPAETEGGFVPKEPLLDGPFYESKFDSNYHNNGVLPLDLPPGTLSPLPAITEAPKTPQEEKCLNGGQSYRHGELLTELSACDLCVCYYGKIICQEPKCPVPDPGCRLLRERDHSTCCRKIVCHNENAESPTRVVDHITPAPHLPPFTVADVIVTPDPFRDVIRTEPAPDLSSLIGEIMPFFWEQSTTSPTPVSIAAAETPGSPETNTAAVFSSTASIVTSTRPQAASVLVDSTVVTTPTTPLTSISSSTLVEFDDLSHTKNETVSIPLDENDNKEINEEGPAEEEFSFESVLSILFGSETTTEKQVLKTKKPSLYNKLNDTRLSSVKTNKTQAVKVGFNQKLEHRSDEDVNDLTNPFNSSHEQDNIWQSGTTSNKTLEVNKSTEFGTTETNPITKSPTEKNILHTTIRNFIDKVTTKRYGTKYSSAHLKPFPTKSTPVATLPLSVPDPGAASGLLKLAGCNIYGRMYRVGRIISELSGPCLECMCTEVGVQCRPLKC
ncbi:hypothetical protein J6590_033286 [Homalodisca vitripennis]|nr:hypothetical protein J6590_033286 [Homalodisca vitripennis]